MIIGLVGKPGSGTKTVAKILELMIFYPVIQRDLDPRSKLSAVEQALLKVREGENYVFTFLSNPEEVIELKKRHDFLLVQVVAPENLRRKRVSHFDDDPELIQKQEDLFRLAKVTIVNNASLEKLQDKVENVIADWMYKLQPSRPDWDHYFMNIAEQVKMRATCMSSKKGSIIVKDKMILSSGYNGTPKCILHCTDGGCQRCTMRHLGKIKSGDYSIPCVCCHGEENAIVQAAYNGVSTRGATIYTTFTPCTNCAKMIINAGIVKVIAKTRYPDDIGTTLLKAAGVELVVLK